MKILKYLFFAVLALVALFLIAAAFIPKEYDIVLTETINRPKAEVYDYVKLFEKQKEYSEWIKPDPNLDIKITGTDGTVGATHHWNSQVDDVGEGSQTITAMTPDQIDVDIKFIRPMAGGASVKNKFESIDSSSTKLTMAFHTTAPYPMNLPSYLFGKGMIEKTEKQILANIKQKLEGR